jgi:hypothetical protein
VEAGLPVAVGVAVAVGEVAQIEPFSHPGSPGVRGWTAIEGFTECDARDGFAFSEETGLTPGPPAPGPPQCAIAVLLPATTMRPAASSATSALRELCSMFRLPTTLWWLVAGYSPEADGPA